MKDIGSSRSSIQRSSRCIESILILMPSFLLFLALLLCRHTKASGCSSPLGLTTGEILDWQISASSSYAASWDAGCRVKYARLHQPNGRAWCAGRKAPGEWLLVDLGVPAKVTGFLTQGKGDGKEWVTKLMVSYSLNAYMWHYVRDIYNNKKEFYANVDSHRPRTNVIEGGIYARFIRIHIQEWHSHPSLRLELLGCQGCKHLISEGFQVKITSSSRIPWKKQHSCQPYDVVLSSQRGWCTRRKNDHQWIQFDLGPPHVVTGVVTKGRGDTRRKQWVRAYTITYSNDSKVWFTYKDGNHLDPKVFGGNLDKYTERRHYLNTPFSGRFIRLNPLRWNKAIAMRAAIYGCPHLGECAENFFRISPDSSCVENLAYNKRTWVNDERHLWSDWNYGTGNLAVDGNGSTNLNSCAIIDNYNNEEPIWMVDLERKTFVTGIVLVTWQGIGQDQKTLYQDYIFGLNKISIFVEKRPRLDPIGSPVFQECVTVTRLNNALFRKRVHVECPQPVKGRYVYIKATGVGNRWQRAFSLILCEVYVY